jgi:hypothetical protein
MADERGGFTYNGFYEEEIFLFLGNNHRIQNYLQSINLNNNFSQQIKVL